MEKTEEQISFNMSQIKCKNTLIERMLCEELKKRKLRFRTNDKTVFGKPDVVFKGKRVAVFCDSVFWHGLNWENDKKKLKKNDDFWTSKIERNIQRDKVVNATLTETGWKVIRFNEKRIKESVSECADEIISALSDVDPRYKSVDLFAGIGGIRLGFQHAFKEKVTVEMVSETDKNAQTTYKQNFSYPETIKEDIREIKLNSVPKFDICMAGFPCQAFSSAGKKEGFEDKTRGTLFYELLRLSKSKKPMVIFCENVKGLLSIDKGNTFKTILDSLTEIGYDPKSMVLNSKDFNIPQNRERIYIVAFRKDVRSDDFEFPKPQRLEVTLKSLLEEDPVDASYYLSEQYLSTLKKHKLNQKAAGNGFGYVVRDETYVDTLAGALMCGGMGRERNLLYDPRTKLPEINPRTGREFNKEHIRMMTPKEWKRLQGFPDDFELPVAKTYQYHQLGNSVTVPVIQAIAEQIKFVLDRHLANGGQR